MPRIPLPSRRTRRIAAIVVLTTLSLATTWCGHALLADGVLAERVTWLRKLVVRKEIAADRSTPKRWFGASVTLTPLGADFSHVNQRSTLASRDELDALKRALSLTGGGIWDVNFAGMPSCFTYTITGWPFHSFWGAETERWGDETPERFTDDGMLRFETTVFQRHPRPHTIRLPLHIDWLPFTGNVLAHAAVWSLLIVTPSALRRLRRKRHGQCLSCGYDRSATPPNAVCPECGTAPGGIQVTV
jgi:hypothetical protein